jgi:hypothetical protein
MEKTSFGYSKNKVLRKISGSKMGKVTEGLRKQHTAELLDLQGSRGKSLRGNKISTVMTKFDFLHSTYCKLLS